MLYALLICQELWTAEVGETARVERERERERERVEVTPRLTRPRQPTCKDWACDCARMCGMREESDDWFDQ